AAAVADYRPKVIHDEKMKKSPGDLRIEMERTTDILQQLSAKKKNQFLVGFAAETTNPIAYGKEKMHKKHLDAIVINNVAADGAGFEQDTNIVTYINKNMNETDIPLATKAEVAKQILSLIDRDMKDEIN